MITGAQLKSILPGCLDPQAWADRFDLLLPGYGITTREQFAHFIGQVAVESQSLNRLIENLNYSADALQIVWPRRFLTRTLAERYARKPEMIANHAYADRMGNGNEASGDGWKFRGHGLIQATGRTNINAALAALGLPLGDPSPLSTPEFACKAAGVYWRDRDCNAFVGDVPALTLTINGGTHGLADRQTFTAAALRVLA